MPSKKSPFVNKYLLTPAKKKDLSSTSCIEKLDHSG